MLNDVHCHFFSPQFFAALGREKGLEAGERRVPELLGWEAPVSVDALADRWAAELDRHGVRRAALIASVPGDEASVASAVARHPSRFVAFAMLDPSAPDGLDRARRALAELGVRALCLFPAMHRYRLDDDRVVAVFEMAEHHRAAVFVHCGLLSVGARRRLGLPSRFDVRLGDPLAVATLAVRFPAVPVIVPHFGAGFFREALMAADLAANVHLDTSSSNAWIRYFPGLTFEQVCRAALDVAGPDRLLFGTDSSFFPRGWQRAIHDTQRAAFERAGCTPAELDRIFGGNFDRLFA